MVPYKLFIYKSDTPVSIFTNVYYLTEKTKVLFMYCVTRIKIKQQTKFI